MTFKKWLQGASFVILAAVLVVLWDNSQGILRGTPVDFSAPGMAQFVATLVTAMIALQLARLFVVDRAGEALLAVTLALIAAGVETYLLLSVPFGYVVNQYASLFAILAYALLHVVQIIVERMAHLGRAGAFKRGFKPEADLWRDRYFDYERQLDAADDTIKGLSAEVARLQQNGHKESVPRPKA